MIRFWLPTTLLAAEAMALLKKVHGSRPAKANSGYGMAAGGHFGHAAEEDAEDDHLRERLQHGPGGAEDGLLVADFDVAPDEEIEQLAIAPHLGEIDDLPAGPGLDDGQVLVGQVRRGQGRRLRSGSQNRGLCGVRGIRFDERAQRKVQLRGRGQAVAY